MSDQTENIAAILAEMRRRSDEAYKGQFGNHVDCVRDQIEIDEIDDWIARIDAAVKLKRDELADAHDAIARLEDELAEVRRERDTACAKQTLSVASVNAAALRAALKDVLDHAPFATDHATMLTGGNDLLARLRHAYYAPARNCDRFADVLRASEAYEATKTDLPFEEWLFSTEKGKETDNV